MEKRVKLLVHAGAASSRQDDEHRAAQAAAYLGLGPMKVAKVVSLRAANAMSNPYGDREELPIADAMATESSYSNVYIEDTQLAYTMLETQLFTSSGIVKSTPALKERNCPAQGATTPARILERDRVDDSPKLASCNAKPRSKRKHPCDTNEIDSGRPVKVRQTPQLRRTVSEPSDPGNAKQHVFGGPESQSSYLPSPALHRHYKRVHLSTSQPSSSQQSNEHSNGQSRGHGTQDLASIWSVSKLTKSNCHEDSGDGTLTTGESTTSEMPTSYSLSDAASDSLKDRQQQAESVVPAAGSQASSGQHPDTERISQQLDMIDNDHPHVATIPSNAHPAEPKTNQLAGVTNLEDSHSTRTMLKRSATATIPVAKVVQPESAQAQAREALDAASMEIRAPPPETSVQQFQTHITKMLRDLAEGPVFQNLYQPVQVLRQLDIHERGFWLIDWSGWLADSQLDFWQQMETLIGNGSAGWGIWCTRSKDVIFDGINASDHDMARVRAGSLDAVSVWCWGEVVKHIYLLLYTLSMGKVRKLGLKWIDATGSVVVQMKGKVPS